MDSSDVIAIIGAVAAAVTLVINTWFSARAKSVSEDTKRLALRHEVKTSQIQDAVDTIAEAVSPSES